MLIVVALGVRYIYWCVHIDVRLCYICLIRLSHAHTDVIIVPPINSSMYICVSVAFVLFFSCDNIRLLSITILLIRSSRVCRRGISNIENSLEKSMIVLQLASSSALQVSHMSLCPAAHMIWISFEYLRQLYIVTKFITLVFAITCLDDMVNDSCRGDCSYSVALLTVLI